MVSDEMSWGSAWLQRLETDVGFDSTALARGGTVIQMGRVNSVEFEPSLVRAEVAGTNELEVVTIGIASLEPAQWDRLVRRTTEAAAQAAALLAGELPVELTSTLLPGKGQVSSDCTCKGGDGLCRHAAAVFHQIAARLDVDPFALMLMRGRDRASVLAALRASRAELMGVEQPSVSGLPRGGDQGVSAAEAWRREPESPVVAPPAPRRPGKLPTLAVPPPAGSGIDENDLASLVADGAARAQAMLAGNGESELGLSVGADVVRRAASGDIGRISEVTKLPVDELTAAVQAWKVGGHAGFKVTRSTWEPEAHTLTAAIEAMGPAATARANVITNGSFQLRVDEDGYWWRFVADDALGWILDSKPVRDPAELM